MLTTHQDAAESFSIGLPASWQYFDVSPKTVQELQARVKNDSKSRTGSLMRAIQNLPPGTRAFVGYASNLARSPYVTVDQLEMDPAITFEDWAQVNQKQYEQLAGQFQNLKIERVQLGVGPALKVTLDYADGTGTTHNRQYGLVHAAAGHAINYVVTFVTAEDTPTVESLFNQMIASFSF